MLFIFSYLQTPYQFPITTENLKFLFIIYFLITKYGNIFFDERFARGALRVLSFLELNWSFLH